MMHFEEVVVTLVGSDNKPLREYNSQRAGRGRKCEVHAPVDTEYKFLVKNNTDRRVKVSIDIDGTNVSGNGLILNAHASDYIERFVDSDKKFKTSRTNGEGVADPTSPENGIVKVRVHKEKVADPIPSITKIVEEHHHHWDYWQPWWNRQGPYYYTANQTYGVKNCVGGVSYDTCSASVGDQPTVRAMNAVSQPVPQESLATVEGSQSNQIFGSTSWIGDDATFAEVVFTFFLKLAAQVVDPEYAEFLRLKQKFDNK